MKIHVIHARNRHLYEREMEDFFRQRHRIYVEEKGWRDAAEDGLEIDQFDTAAATYLIGIVDGRVMTGSRFVPTTRPHLLSEVFHHLCDFEGVVRDPTVAEWTRGFIIPEFREVAGVNLKAQFCATVMEYCLNQGITRIGGIQEIYWLPLWKRFRWTVRPVGSPSLIDGEWCVPAYFDVSEEAFAGAWRFARLQESILVERGPRQDFVSAAGELRSRAA